jgi:hypothetical protein
MSVRAGELFVKLGIAPSPCVLIGNRQPDGLSLAPRISAVVHVRQTSYLSIIGGASQENAAAGRLGRTLTDAPARLDWPRSDGKRADRRPPFIRDAASNRRPSRRSLFMPRPEGERAVRTPRTEAAGLQADASMLTLHLYFARELLKTFLMTSVALTLLIVMGGGVANIFRGEGIGAEEMARVSCSSRRSRSR